MADERAGEAELLPRLSLKPNRQFAGIYAKLISGKEADWASASLEASSCGPSCSFCRQGSLRSVLSRLSRAGAATAPANYGAPQSADGCRAWQARAGEWEWRARHTHALAVRKRSCRLRRAFRALWHRLSRLAETVDVVPPLPGTTRRPAMSGVAPLSVAY